MTDPSVPRMFDQTGEIESLKRQLNHGGGDGTSGGGMDERVIRLEANLDHLKGDVSALKSDVSALKVDVATIKETLRHLPGKGFIFSVALGLLAATGGLTALIVRFLPHAS